MRKNPLIGLKQLDQSVWLDNLRRKLEEKGGRIQRILCGGSGTRNPKYSDIKYVQELIGPDSINTMPGTTMMAFKGRAQVKITVNDALEEAERLFPELKTSMRRQNNWNARAFNFFQTLSLLC